MSAGKGRSSRGLLGGRAVTQLKLAMRFFRLYPHHHPLCASAIEDAHAACAAFAKAEGTLAMQVREDGLSIDDELIEDEASDFSTLLYGEGVRELVFEPELEIEELGRFVGILSAPYPEGDEASFSDDLLTALWREDLQSIEYRIFDPLAASFVRSRGGRGALGEVAARIRGLVEEFGGHLSARPASERSAEEIEAEALFRQREEMSEEDEELSWSARPERAPEYLVSEEGKDRRLLAAELREPQGLEFLGRVAEVVVWALDEPEQIAANKDALRFFCGATVHALKQGDLALATKLTGEVGRVEESRSSLGPAVFSRLAAPDALTSLGTALASRTEERAEAVTGEGLAYLSRLGSRAIPSIRSIYPEVESDLVRGMYRDFMTRRIEDSLETLVALARSEDAKVARETVEALASLGADSIAFECLRGLAKSSGPARQFARERVDDLSGETRRRELLDTVAKGFDASARLDALFVLSKHPNPRTFAALVPVLKGSAILGRPEEEQQAIVDLMRRSGGARTRVVFRAFADQRLPMLKRRAEAQALRKLVVEALAAVERGQP